MSDCVSFIDCSVCIIVLSSCVLGDMLYMVNLLSEHGINCIFEEYVLNIRIIGDVQQCSNMWSRHFNTHT